MADSLVIEFRAEWFNFRMSTEIATLVIDILEELIDRNGLPLHEAVARINAQWSESGVIGPTDIVLHETGFFWSTVILYEEPIPDWWEQADRSSWARRVAPPADSGCWTV
jgi:hypothetical protein